MWQVLSEVVMHGGGADDERWLPATEAALNAMAQVSPLPPLSRARSAYN